jgi:hypothetical protein
MTGESPSPTRNNAQIEVAVERLVPALLEVATLWVRPGGDIPMQMLEVTVALLRAAVVQALVINKCYGVDCKVLADLARAEIARIDAAAKPPAPKISPSPNSDGTGTRH